MSSYKLKNRCSIRCFGPYFFYSSHALLIIRPPADFTLPYSYTIIQPCITCITVEPDFEDDTQYRDNSL